MIIIQPKENENEGASQAADPSLFVVECRYCSIDDLPKPISDFTWAGKFK